MHVSRRNVRIPAEGQRSGPRAESDSRGGIALRGDSKRRETGQSGSDRIRGYFLFGGTHGFVGPSGETPAGVREERFSRGELRGGNARDASAWGISAERRDGIGEMVETLRSGVKSEAAMRQVVSDFNVLIELAFVGDGGEGEA